MRVELMEHFGACKACSLFVPTDDGGAPTDEPPELVLCDTACDLIGVVHGTRIAGKLGSAPPEPE